MAGRLGAPELEDKRKKPYQSPLTPRVRAWELTP